MAVIVTLPLSGPSLMPFDSNNLANVHCYTPMSHVIPLIMVLINRFLWHWMGSTAWNNQSMRYCGPWWLLSHGHYLVHLLWHWTAITWQCTFLHSMSHVIPLIVVLINRFPWHWMGNIVWNNQSVRYYGPWWLLSNGRTIWSLSYGIRQQYLGNVLSYTQFIVLYTNWNRNRFVSMALVGKNCLEQPKHALVLWSMTVMVAWPLSGPSLMAFDSIKTWQLTF